jgi:hypothetical protein
VIGTCVSYVQRRKDESIYGRKNKADRNRNNMFVKARVVRRGVRLCWGSISVMHDLDSFLLLHTDHLSCRNCCSNACCAKTSMLDEVCGRPRHASHDSARSWGSRVVQVEGGCRYSVEDCVSGLQCITGRQFLSPYVACPLQQHCLRPGTCAYPY